MERIRLQIKTRKNLHLNRFFAINLSDSCGFMSALFRWEARRRTLSLDHLETWRGQDDDISPRPASCDN